MNEIRTLMEKFWICRDSDKETFYKVKSDIPNFQRFIRDQLGWKLIHTEKLLKLEKRPAHAEAFMGINEFTDIRDYCILCVVLMYLEDAEEGKQFLLSELIDYVETQLKIYLPVDWTSFTQRKSLVRVLQYMERLQMLRVYEGKSESFSQEAGQEVLYENTGYSKYFTSSFTTDISGYESWRDFEKTDFEEFQENRGSWRINRVYRQLAVCPAFYWNSTEDADALYLKNQRQWVGKYLQENMGGNLDIYRNAAFLTLETDDCYGTVHPRDAQISESVLIICAEIQRRLTEGKLELREDESIAMTRQEFSKIVTDSRNKWKNAWSKEYCEMDEDRLVDAILKYMTDWMMVRSVEERIIVLPAVGRLAGQYPSDYKGDGEE
ncbi:MAG: TIGR02678 family protein [Lachnospiraceae bacterium]|nr:TIGR02678 family protein [Lachnospiraceae bacterium]